MIKILFVCHGSTADSQELAALVGLKRGKSGQLRKWVTTSEETKKVPLFQAFFS